MKKSTKLPSCIIAILVIIIAMAALVSEWSLLRKIHTDIVDQYNKDPDAPLYYNRSSFCDTLDLESFNVFTFPVACFLALLCIIVTKRRSLLPTLCYGYIAPPIPVDFLAHVDRKFAAVIFAIIANDLLGIVQDAVTGTDHSSAGILVSFLLRILQVLFMGLRYFPILAAVYINSILMLICATLYAWLDYAFDIVSQGMCYPDYYPDYNDYLDGDTDINDKLKYYGTGPALLAIQVCTDIPRFLLLAYISVNLPIMLIKKIYYFYGKKDLSAEEMMLMSVRREEKILLNVSRPDSVEMLYVRNLFRSPDQIPPSKALIARLIPKLIYEWRDDFQFSSRILCIYSAVFLLLFLVIIWACVSLVPYLSTVVKSLQDTITTIANAIIDNGTDFSQSSFPFPNLVRPFLFAVGVTSTIMVIQLLVLLANIRRNLLQAFRGDDSEIPRRDPSRHVSYATGNFHFAGYFIGYLVWGFIIMSTFITIICACIYAFIEYGSVRFLEKILKAIIPSLLLVLFKLYLNKLLAQYVFLQHCGDVLALDNRRFLMIFIFFNFFLDAFLGFISAILRMIITAIAAIIYMCRLDYSVLGRKLETFDSGFNAYCGFIHTECAHRHPVMLVFVSFLLNEIRRRQYKIKENHLDDSPIPEKELIQRQKSLRYIRKWRLAAFLIQNPTIIICRKAYLRRLRAEHLQAINVVDKNNEYGVQGGIVFYSYPMVTKRSSSSPESDQPIIIRF